MRVRRTEARSGGRLGLGAEPKPVAGAMRCEVQVTVSDFERVLLYYNDIM